MNDNTPNPSNYDSFNDYIEAVENFQPAWVIMDTDNDTIIIECETKNDALNKMYELTRYEKAHGTYRRGKNRIMPIENNTENTTDTDDTGNEE